MKTLSALMRATVAACCLCSQLSALSAQPIAQADLGAIERLREYRFSADRTVLDAADAVVRAAMASPERRAAVADALAAVP
ncbi:MAG: hypothetical protein FJX72_04715, partial [Armatimonadetes bacterium]|nr:hypothetical protein [Armatimonadota bacterium]